MISKVVETMKMPFSSCHHREKLSPKNLRQSDKFHFKKTSHFLYETSNFSKCFLDLHPGNQVSTSTDPAVPTKPPLPSSTSQNLHNYFVKDDISRAEILWCLQTIMSHDSLRSAGKSVLLFKRMFFDSEIAKSMKLQRTKMSYTLVYGIAPYFHDQLREECDEADHIVLGFDESLNKVVQKGQMDIVIRYWNSEKEEVATRYFNSAFMGHATASNVLCAFLQATKELDLPKLLQVSMDGPNVNLKFHKDLKSYLKGDPGSPELLELGSCGLHAVNNAFKNAFKSVEWNIVAFLRALHNLFHNVPARRADFIHFSGSQEFPLKFCAVRWIENQRVAERAMRMTPFVQKYIREVEANKKQPSCDSYKTVRECLKDPFLQAKLGFFQSLASEVEPFLTKFQSNEPLAPLLYESLLTLMRTVMTRFIKQAVFDKESNLTKIDCSLKENLLSAKEIHLGYVTTEAIRTVRKSVSDRDILEFRQNCREILQNFCVKLMTRSPLQFKLTKGLSFLDPKVTTSSVRNRRLKLTLEEFIQHNWISGLQADQIEKQLKAICTSELCSQALTHRSDQRLDHLWMHEIVPKSKEYDELRALLRMIFILSHGNASLERGFSVNKECLLENLSETSLVAQRQIYDAVTNLGEVEDLEIPKKLIQSCRNSRQRYEEAMKKKKAEVTENEDKENNKRQTTLILKTLASEKKRIMEETHQKLSLIDEEIRSLT